MTWLYIILVSYFILSISNLVDKIFLSKIVPESIVYAIWVSILSVVIVVLLVLDVLLNRATGDAATGALGGLSWMTPAFILLAIFIGMLFTLAIYLLYSALQRGEASRVIPLIGGSMPLIIYVMSFWYDPLSHGKLTAFVFLVVGTILISLTPRHDNHSHKGSGTVRALGASLSFALFFVLSQYLFWQQGFLNGIVWPRLGTALVLIALFTRRPVRRMIAQSLKPLSLKLRSIWVMSQGLGAIGFVGQQYAISIPGVSVALVSALQSLQYVFILIFATTLTLMRPRLLREYISASVIVQKVAALLCIAAGLYFVSI